MKQNRTQLYALDGGVLVSKATIIQLLQHLRPAALGRDATLFECGKEEQKRITAEVLKREFNIDTGFNPAVDMIAHLRK